jgi:hypothetical protein
MITYKLTSSFTGFTLTSDRLETLFAKFKDGLNENSAGIYSITMPDEKGYDRVFYTLTVYKGKITLIE